MINLMRKHQQALMVLITVCVIIAFVWFYNGTRTSAIDKIGTDRIATMYGRSITQGDLDREARRHQIAIELGLFDIVRDLGTLNQNQPTDQFVFNVMVMRHEAKLLQIEPTDDEVSSAMQQLPAFQTDGAFDAQKLAAFVAEKLLPRGFTDTQIDDLLRDAVRLKKVRSLIGATSGMTESEYRAAYELGHQNTESSFVRLRLSDIAPLVQLSDDDVKKAYEQRKDSLKSDEKRSIKFVTLALSDAEKSLKGKERIDALSKLANKAEDFTQAMLDKNANIDQVAAKFNLPVTATGEFTQFKPDPKLEKFSSISEAAFKLTTDAPTSDAIQTDDAFYILHLEKIVPSKLLTFDEAKEQLTSQLKNERAQEQLTQKAAELRGKIETALKAGKSFAEAAQAAGQKVETIPAFSIAEPGKIDDPEMRGMMGKAIELGVGDLSEFIPTTDGGFLIHVDKRPPIDEAKLEKDKVTGLPSFQTAKEEMAFREWLRIRRDAAKITAVRS